jgi:hypothetical protein
MAKATSTLVAFLAALFAVAAAQSIRTINGSIIMEIAGGVIFLVLSARCCLEKAHMPSQPP